MSDERYRVAIDKLKAKQAELEAKSLAGFYSDPNCRGCGEPLTIDNAWMVDGCPCSSPAGVNTRSERRWALLMQLQQLQARELEKLKSGVEGVSLTPEQRVFSATCRFEEIRPPILDAWLRFFERLPELTTEERSAFVQSMEMATLVAVVRDEPNEEENG